MTVIRGADGEVDQYCSEYFSVAKFMAAYAENVPALVGKDQWNIASLELKVIVRVEISKNMRWGFYNFEM